MNTTQINAIDWVTKISEIKLEVDENKDETTSAIRGRQQTYLRLRAIHKIAVTELPVAVVAPCERETSG